MIVDANRKDIIPYYKKNLYYLVKFLLTGGTASAINWASGAALSKIIDFRYAVILSYIIGMVFSFFVYRRFVFTGAANTRTSQLRRFLLVNAAGLVTVTATTGIFMFFALMAGFSKSSLVMLISHGAGIFCGAGITYFGHKLLTFSEAPRLFLQQINPRIHALISYFLCLTLFTPSGADRHCVGAEDCTSYVNMADHFWQWSEGLRPIVDAPYGQRLLTPLIAGLTHLSGIGYGPINAGFMYLCLAALALASKWVCLQLRLPSVYLYFLPFWLSISPVGLSIYDNAILNPDMFAYVILTAFLACLLARRIVLCAVFCLIGILDKESFLLVTALWLCSEIIDFSISAFSDRIQFRSVASVAVAALTLIFTVLLSSWINTTWRPTQGYIPSASMTFAWWWNEALQDPQRFFVWLACIFYSSGITISVLLKSARSVVMDPAHRVTMLVCAAGCVAYMMLGLLAGSDMSRIVLNGVPYYSVALLLLASRGRDAIPLQILTISVFSLMSMTIPSKYLEYGWYLSKSLSHFEFIACGLALAVLYMIVGKGNMQLRGFSKQLHASSGVESAHYVCRDSAYVVSKADLEDPTIKVDAESIETPVRR